MSLYAAFTRKGPSGFGYGSTAEDVTQGVELGGRTYLLTGSNSGIGLETLRVLALRGAHVIAAARTVEKARAALDSVGAVGTPIACELSDPASVRAATSEIRESGRALDGIICNAGIMALPKLELSHGYELQFFTNHVGHFILVTGLLDELTPAGRVVVVSSGAHAAAPSAGIEFDNLRGEGTYRPWRAYGQAKLANLLFAKALARRLDGTGRTANALHPGVIATNLWRHMGPAASAGAFIGKALFLKTIAQGAATTCYVATHPDVTANGEYFADCNVAVPTKTARDVELAERLWTQTEAIVAGLAAKPAASSGHDGDGHRQLRREDRRGAPDERTFDGR